MALATKCPHCQTTFRVAHDQLKLRAGLVRCGACKEIFNGIEHLLRPDEQAPAPATGIAPPAVPVAVPAHVPPALPLPPPPVDISTPPVQRSTSDRKPDGSVGAEMSNTQSITAPAPIEPPVKSTRGKAIDVAASIESAALASSLDFDVMPAREPWSTPKDRSTSALPDPALGDPLQRMTLMDFTEVPPHRPHDDAAAPLIAPADPNAADAIDDAIEDLKRKPWRDESKPIDDLDDPEAADSAIPGFIKRGQRQQRFGRALRVTMIGGSLILMLALVAQGAYIFRNQLAATLPQTKSLLVKACVMLGCQVGLPAKIDAVSIESSELQAAPPAKDAFMLTLLLRNRSTTVQAWPNIELTLNDANEKAIGRRVFLPREYLAPTVDSTKGFAQNSEQPIKVPFELTQLKASGFRVYLFYP